MEEYRVIFPIPEINSRQDRDEHHDKLEILIQQLLDEQQRAFNQMRDKGIR